MAKITTYIDNICGVAVAHESKEFESYRSGRPLSGKGAGEEEPVFILLFHSPYGLAFFRNSRHSEGPQLQDPRLYHLDPKAQELYQSFRWNNGMIILNVERASRIMNLVWPVKERKNLYKRVDLIRKKLDILYENGFITKPHEPSKTIDKMTWVLWRRRKTRIKNRYTGN